jgi:hypothetical protein
MANAHRSVQSPSPRFARLGPTSLYSAFSNQVRVGLEYGMANMRLILRDVGPIGTTVSLPLQWQRQRLDLLIALT